MANQSKPTSHPHSYKPLLDAAQKVPGSIVSLNVSFPMEPIPIVEEPPPEQIPGLAFPGWQTYDHTPDFRAIWWYGIPFRLDHTQSAVIQFLHNAYENSWDHVPVEAVLTYLKRPETTIPRLFKSVPHWQELLLETTDDEGRPAIKLHFRKR